MVKIIILKDAEGYKKGQIVLIKNNYAHRLVDNGLAKVYTNNDKMMRPKKGGRKWR